MTKRATIRINLFKRKSGVHSVMPPRQIIFGKEFKTTLCKMGELVLAYEVQANNKTSKPRAFFPLYIEPNDGGTSHSVFKTSTKMVIITSRYKTVSMPNNVIKVVNQMKKDEGMPDRIVFLQHT